MRRLEQHRAGTGSTFTARYPVHKLVYAEAFPFVHDAIAREKEIKAWRREKKLALIRDTNPEMEDLSGVGRGDPSLRSGRQQGGKAANGGCQIFRASAYAAW